MTQAGGCARGRGRGACCARLAFTGCWPLHGAPLPGAAAARRVRTARRSAPQRLPSFAGQPAEGRGGRRGQERPLDRCGPHGGACRAAPGHTHAAQLRSHATRTQRSCSPHPTSSPACRARLLEEHRGHLPAYLSSIRTNKCTSKETPSLVQGAHLLEEHRGHLAVERRLERKVHLEGQPGGVGGGAQPARGGGRRAARQRKWSAPAAQRYAPPRHCRCRNEGRRTKALCRAWAVALFGTPT